jgi:hypothetical protein
MKAPLNDPIMARFAFAFDAVTRLARAADGFWWQLESHGPGHPVLHPDDPLRMVNVSAWVDYGFLHEFVYRSVHGQALLRRADWFEAVSQPSTALWWVPIDAMPSLEAAVARLSHLRRYGPSPGAFTLRHRFGAAGHPDGRPRRARPSGT